MQICSKGDICQILILGVLYKSLTETSKDIIKSMRENLLHIKGKIWTQRYFNRNIFLVVIFLISNFSRIKHPNNLIKVNYLLT